MASIYTISSPCGRFINVSKLDYVVYDFQFILVVIHRFAKLPTSLFSRRIGKTRWRILKTSVEREIIASILRALILRDFWLGRINRRGINLPSKGSKGWRSWNRTPIEFCLKISPPISPPIQLFTVLLNSKLKIRTTRMSNRSDSMNFLDILHEKLAALLSLYLGVQFGIRNKTFRRLAPI